MIPELFKLVEKGYKRPQYFDIIELYVALDTNNTIHFFDKQLSEVNNTEIVVEKLDSNNYLLKKDKYCVKYQTD